MEVAAGLEPAKTGFADQRLDRFGIATKLSKTLVQLVLSVMSKTVLKTAP